MYAGAQLVAQRLVQPLVQLFAVVVQPPWQLFCVERQALRHASPAAPEGHLTAHAVAAASQPLTHRPCCELQSLLQGVEQVLSQRLRRASQALAQLAEAGHASGAASGAV